MSWIALKMLLGDRLKYLGMVFGVAFASLLISQQASIFCGLMSLTASQINDTRGADIWVMNAGVRYIDDVRGIADADLYRVRGVAGVAWAVKLYKGLARARLLDGRYHQMILLGVDDDSLTGAPGEMVLGAVGDLRRPDAVILDERGYRKLWPGQAFQLGRSLELNDRRGVLVGVCKASRTFQTLPVLYTRYSLAIGFSAPDRRQLSFVLAQGRPDSSPEEVCARIARQTKLQALTQDQFKWKTIQYYLKETGILANFGITVFLGFVVGAAIAGQTFYLFTIDNLRQFGCLKAMGVSNGRIVRMMMLQAGVTGLIGYSLGVGGAALFGWCATRADKVVCYMPWQVLALTGGAVLLIMLLSSLLSVRRVLVLEPAIVFRG